MVISILKQNGFSLIQSGCTGYLKSDHRLTCKIRGLIFLFFKLVFK